MADSFARKKGALSFFRVALTYRHRLSNKKLATLTISGISDEFPLLADSVEKVGSGFHSRKVRA